MAAAMAYYVALSFFPLVIVLTAGVSAFVDADMNEASTRNQALQTQQQLGVQALSMANQNSQMILKLFQ